MSEIKTNYTKKGKPKMFLLFLFVTTFIWFISKFSREFTSNLEAEIHSTFGFAHFLYFSFKCPLQFDVEASFII